jgi:hypothetical protein
MEEEEGRGNVPAAFTLEWRAADEALRGVKYLDAASDHFSRSVGFSETEELDQRPWPHALRSRPEVSSRYAARDSASVRNRPLRALHKSQA